MKCLQTNAHVLNIADPLKEFLVCTNSYKEGLGGVLMQEEHIIFYESKKLNEDEINYVTRDLQLVSIVHDLTMWRHYLLGRIFILMTDHSGLRYMFDQPKLNTRQARWMALLSEFNFEIKHIKEKENKVVDALSISMNVIHLEIVRTCEMNVRERVKSAQEENSFFDTVKSYLEQEPTGLMYEGYQLLNDGLLTYKGRLYILKCDDLKRSMMDELHKIPYIGHHGYQKMITSTRKLFYCPRLKKNIVNYLAKSLECKKVKVEHWHLAVLFQPLPIPE
jgi:hypothetical protein